MKKLLISALLLLISTCLYAQTWEKLKTDSTGFLNQDRYSYATYKSYNNEQYISEFKDVYKFGTYGWKKIQSLTATISEYDYIVLPEDTVVYAYINNSTSKLNVIKTKGAYQEVIGNAEFASADNSVILSRSVNGNFVITYLDNNNLVKAMTCINGVWQNLEATNPTPGVDYRYAFSNQNNQPTIAYKKQSDSKLYVTQFNGTNWIQLGGSINPNWVKGDYDICQDVDGTLYLLYINKDEVASLLKWTGTAWTTLSTLPKSGSGLYGTVKLAVSNGIVYIANNYAGLLNVKKFNGTTLSQVGPASLSTTLSITNFFVQSFNGNVGIFYPQDLWGGKMTLSTWDNTTTTWKPLDAVSLKKGITGISTITDANNIMYTAFRDVEAGGKITVMKYTNGTWNYVGTPGFSATTGNNTTLTFDTNNVLHVLFVGSDKKLNAYKFDGAQWVEISQNWTAYGLYKDIYAKFNSSNTLYIGCYTGTNNLVIDYGYSYKYTSSNVFSQLPDVWGNNISSFQMTLDASGLPVVAFTDYKSSYQIYVKKFNGSGWADVTPAVINSDGSGAASITTDKNGVLYIGYNSFTSQGYNIKKLQGSSWIAVSAARVSTNNVSFPQLRFNAKNELSAFYVENSQLKARKLTGTTWSDLGNTNFNNVTFNRLSVAVNKNDYYIAHSFLGGFAYRLLETPEVLTPATIAVSQGTTTIPSNNSVALDLGSATFGSAVSPATTITIKNTGNSNLNISSITTSPGFVLSALSSVSPIIGVELSTFTITATPNAVGINTGTITINSNDATTPAFKLNVRVTGTVPAMVVSQGATTITTNNSPELDLGTAPIKTTVTPATTITIQNTGLGTLTISSITSSSGFATGTLTPSTAIASGATSTFTITATPGSAGLNTGSITINSNDPTAGIFKLNVRATGAVPVMVVSQGATTITANNSPELDLGTATINTPVSSPTTITIKNTGEAPLNISSIVTSSGFVLGTLTPSSPIAAGSTSTFTITAKPGTVGVNAGTITINSNDATPAFKLNVRVTGTETPKPIMVVSQGSTIITVSSPTLNLGTATVNTTVSTVTTITIQNTGGAPLDISSISRSNSDFTLSAVTPSGSIAAGASATFTITAKPSVVGTNSSQITINSNATPSFLLFNVTATGTALPAPVIVVSQGTTIIPNSTATLLDIGTATVNTTVSPATTITIQNTGNAALKINYVISLMSNFTVGTVSPSGSIAPDESATFTIRGRPTVAGINSGVIIINSNLGDYRVTVSVTGTPVHVPKPVMVVSQGATVLTTNNSLDMGTATINTAISPATTITIQNTGDAPLNVASITPSTGFALSGLTPANPIAAGTSSTFTITGSPAVTGTNTGTVTIQTDDQTTPTFLLNVTATGTDPLVPGIGISENSTTYTSGNTTYTFAPTIQGSKSAAIEFTITNTGTAQLLLTTPVVTGPFELSGPASLSVNPGSTTTYTLVFSPTTTGIVTGNVSFPSNVSDSPFILNLSGTGTLSTVTVGKLSSDAISIRPNPSNGVVAIQMNGAFDNISINIYNALGELVLTDSLGDMNNSSYSLLLGDKAAGIYFLEIITEQGTSLKRLIKE